MGRNSYPANWFGGWFPAVASSPTTYLDNVQLRFGTPVDVVLEWNTAQTKDAMLMGVSGSNNFIITTKTRVDADYDFTFADSGTPRLFVTSGAAAVDEYIAIGHDGTDANIRTGTGNINLNGTIYVTTHIQMDDTDALKQGTVQNYIQQFDGTNETLTFAAVAADVAGAGYTITLPAGGTVTSGVGLVGGFVTRTLGAGSAGFAGADNIGGVGGADTTVTGAGGAAASGGGAVAGGAGGARVLTLGLGGAGAGGGATGAQGAFTINGPVAITPATAAVGLTVEMGANDVVGIRVNADHTGASNPGIYVTGKFAGLFTQDVPDGYGLAVDRNIAEVGANPLASFIDEDATVTQALIYGRTDGTANILDLWGGAVNALTLDNLGALGIAAGLTVGAASAFTGNITANDAAGPAFMDEAATTTNPTLIPNKAETDTGIGWASDTIHLVGGGSTLGNFSSTGMTAIGSVTAITSAGGTEWARILHNGTQGRLESGQGGLQFAGSLYANDAAGPILTDEAATSTNPTLCPNRVEGDTGIGWASDTLYVVLGGGAEYSFSKTSLGMNSNTITGAGSISANDAAGPIIINEAATSTNPTLCPNRAEGDTGIGWATDTIIFVGGGVDLGRISSTSSLSLKEKASADANVAAYGQLWVKNTAPSQLWFTDDDGNDQQIAAFDVDSAEMIITAGKTVTMETADTPMAVYDISTGSVADWTFTTGLTAAITVYADYSGTVTDAILATAAGHGLATGDIITIRGTTAPNDYNGVWQVTVISASQFYFVSTGLWNADAGASDFEMGGYLTPDAGAEGEYTLDWNMSITKAAGSSAETTTRVYQDITEQAKARRQRTIAGTDTGAVAGGCHITVSAGQRIWLALESDNTNNLTIQSMTIRAHRLT